MPPSCRGLEGGGGERSNIEKSKLESKREREENSGNRRELKLSGLGREFNGVEINSGSSICVSWFGPGWGLNRPEGANSRGILLSFCLRLCFEHSWHAFLLLLFLLLFEFFRQRLNFSILDIKGVLHTERCASTGRHGIDVGFEKLLNPLFFLSAPLFMAESGARPEWHPEVRVDGS